MYSTTSDRYHVISPGYDNLLVQGNSTGDPTATSILFIDSHLVIYPCTKSINVYWNTSLLITI